MTNLLVNVTRFFAKVLRLSVKVTMQVLARLFANYTMYEVRVHSQKLQKILFYATLSGMTLYIYIYPHTNVTLCEFITPKI